METVCTATVLPKSRNEHLLTLVCVPTPCFCTYTEAKAGTRNGAFPERQTAELQSTKKPEHRLKSQAPKHFSNHRPAWSPAMVQIQTRSLNLRKELSSVHAWGMPSHPRRAFSRNIEYLDRSTMRWVSFSACPGLMPECLFTHF